MMQKAEGVLLYTCAVIWLANGDPPPQHVTAAITVAAMTGGTFVSPISAWEVGLLSNPRGNRSALRFMPDPRTWFAKLTARTGIRHAALTPDIAVDASYLPGSLHGDPADRLLAATARHLGAPLVTRDDKLIAYGEQGFMQVLAC